MTRDWLPMRVVVWNAAWASPRSTKGRRIAEIVAGHEPDLVVLTEGESALLPTSGHHLEANADWGYRPRRPSLRKVLLWSRNPWSAVDTVGHPDLPTGRWVAGSTDVDGGSVSVCGVCIPWSGAHVSTGRRDRRRWEDHRTYLDRLTGLVEGQPRPLVVAGDLNQRIPRRRQPEDVFGSLMDALAGLEVPTAGEHDGVRLIDHVAHSPGLGRATVEQIEPVDDGVELTDHTGVVVDLG